MKREKSTSVSAVYDGKALVPDKPVHIQAGKKYHLIIENISPDKPQIGTSDTFHICKAACMSGRVLTRAWVTSEEDEAWEYL